MVKNVKPSDQGKNGQGSTSQATQSGVTMNDASGATNTACPDPSLNPDGSSSAGSATEPGDRLNQGALQDDAGATDTRTEDRIPCLIIAAKVDGFRRIGKAWSTTPRAVPVSDLTREQVEELFFDSGLVVSEGMVPADRVDRFEQDE